MRTHTAARLGWAMFALSVLLFVPAVILNLGRPQDANLAFTTGKLVLRLAFLLFGWFGALIVSRRPGHRWGVGPVAPPRQGAAAAAHARPVGILGMLYHLGSWATELAILAAVASLVARFRRARSAERQQLKWLFYWVAVLVVGFPITAVALDKVSSELAADLVFALLIVPIPLAVGVAIVRHRPYDIDRLINRTLVYGLLTALLATVYAGVVLVLAQLFGGLGAEPPSWAIATATLTVATLFQPARRRIQQAVDQRFNRRKYDAAKTIERFSGRLRDELDLDTLSAELLAVVDQSMQPTSASLWLRPSPKGHAAPKLSQGA